LVFEKWGPEGIGLFYTPEAVFTTIKGFPVSSSVASTQTRLRNPPEINNIFLTLEVKNHRNRVPLRNRWWSGHSLICEKLNPDAVSEVANVIDSLRRCNGWRGEEGQVKQCLPVLAKSPTRSA